MSYHSPLEIASLFKESAVTKNSFTSSRLFIYSILGGAFIALGGLLSLVVVGGMPGVAASNPGITKFLFGALFPLGLVLVVIAGAELFTSDCAVIPFGILHKKLKLKSLFRIWTIVYIGNFVGGLIVAYLFAFKTGILQADPWLSAAKHLAEHKASGSFITIFIKGIGANWLVCMAVWVAYAAKDVGGKIIGMWFPVMCFVAFGFEHSIANMFFIPTAMLLGSDISVYQLLIGNLLPATLGNIVGGALFVAVPYWYMFKNNLAVANKTTVRNDTIQTSMNNVSTFEKHLN
jgi:formate transporter